LIGANWSVDEKQAWFGYGFSTIISPRGEVLATAKTLHGSEIVYATIETAGATQGNRGVGSHEGQSKLLDGP
jgi:predicted amidohydrolase